MPSNKHFLPLFDNEDGTCSHVCDLSKHCTAPYLSDDRGALAMLVPSGPDPDLTQLGIILKVLHNDESGLG